MSKVFNAINFDPHKTYFNDLFDKSDECLGVIPFF